MKTLPTRSAIVLSFASLMLFSTATQAAIVNGDFETNAALFTAFPGYVDQSGNPSEIFGYIDTSISGHGLNPGSGAGAPFRDNGNNATNVAFIQATNGTIQQNVTGLLPLGIYQLDFEYNARTGSAIAGLTVTMGGGVFTDPSVVAVGGANPYYLGSFQFTPFFPTESLTILKTDFTPGDSTILIDNLVLTLVQAPVPEPSTLCLMGIGIVGLAIKNRRRRLFRNANS